VIEVERPEAGEWRAQVRLLPKLKPRRGPEVRVHHRVHVSGSRVKFALSTPQPVYAAGETVRLLGQVAVGRTLSGVRMRGTVTAPSGRVARIELEENAKGHPGGRGPRSGCHCAEFVPEEEGPHVFRITADDLDLRARIADGGDVECAEGDRTPNEVPFVRHASLTVLVGDPPVPSARARPRRLARGERRRVRIRFRNVAWVPGVSRLRLGEGIRVEEDLRRPPRRGDPVFLVEADARAEARWHDATVLTGGRRYRLPRLIRLEE